MTIDASDVFTIGLFALGVLMLMGVLVEVSVMDPLASENALKLCTERGYDYAGSYSKVVFSTTPLGVKCAYASKEMIVIDGKGYPVERVDEHKTIVEVS